MSKKRRMIVIAGLVMAMTSATVPAIVMTGCNNKQTTPANKQITGEYYDETDNFILQLFGDGYTYTMYVNGVKTEGTYTFKGDNLALTIGGNIVTAKVNKNKDNITLNYNNKDYSLSQTSIRTLSFDTDGADAIASQLIADGRTGVRPADPTKSGSIFLGWFDGSDKVTPFDFGAALTGDKTAYAKFVAIDADADNYTVTFDAGEGATVAEATATTINGRLYNLPTPEKTGSTFVGWWVSHYGTADKLTYKYDGQVLKEDTTFYAVWNTDLDGAPAVSVTSSGISWTASGVANQYKVVVFNKDEVKVVDTTTGSTSYNYDFTTKDAGDYRVEITLNGKTTAAYFKNKALDKVGGFSWQGSTLSFEEVANATDYYITVECGNAAHVHTDVHLDGTSYDFSACEMTAEGIKFTVKARAAGFGESVAEYTVVKNLADVTGLDVDAATETLKWNAVENATSYEVEISNGGHTNTYTVTSPSYDLKFLTGEIAAKVTAKAHGYNSSAAVTKNYTKISLPAPNNLKLVSGAIQWDPVDGAVGGYVISINGTERTVTEGTQYSTDDPLFDGDFGTSYNIFVKAIGESAEKNSVYSNKFIATSGVMGAIDYANGKASWNGVIGAVKYGVKVNDGAETIVDDANELKVTFDKKGTNVISIRCYSDDNIPSAWATKEVTAFEVKFDTLGGYQIDDMPAETLSYFLAAGDELTLPASILKTGYTFQGWYPTEGGAADGGQKFGATATFTKDTTVYAYCTGNKYKVTINAQGGLLEDEQTQFEVTFGSAFSLPVPESESGSLAFDGWYAEYNNNQSIRYCNPDGTSAVNWNTPNDNLVLYPVWVEIFTFTQPKADGGGLEPYYVVSGNANIKRVARAKVPDTYNGLPVKMIEGNCFKDCKLLKTIDLPDTLTYIAFGEYGYNAAGSSFAGCTELENINIYHVAGNTDVRFFSDNGVLYGRLDETGNEAQVLYCPYGRKDTISVAKTLGGLKDGDDIGEFAVTTIGVNVFKQLEISKIYIPSSVTIINADAFNSCRKLKSIVFLPPSEGEEARTLSIDDGAFSNCRYVETITFPKRLTDFNRNMFGFDMGSLTKIYVSDEEGVDGEGTTYASVNGLLCNKEKTELLFVGGGVGGEEGVNGVFVIPSGITTIKSYAFYHCLNITDLTIPAHVTNIETKAFMRCNNIKNLIFEGDEVSEDLTIDDYAFCANNMDIKESSGLAMFYNTVLTSVTLPANLKKLGTGVFAYCNKLVTVNVNCNRAEVDYSDNVASLDLPIQGESYNYRDPSDITTVNLGKDCPEFSVSGVFGAKISTVNVDLKNQYYTAIDNVLYNKAVTKILYFPLEKDGEYVIPDTVTSIDANTFTQRTKLSKVTIPGSVTSIGYRAFWGCSGLKEVVFSEGTNDLTIGEAAFSDCNNSEFTSIDIPARCKSLGVSVFESDKKLRTITLHEGLEKIGNRAFYHCRALTSITIPSTCTKIGSYSDKGVLTSITEVFQMVDSNLISSDNKGELAAINVTEGNTAFKSVNGVLYMLTKASEEAEAKATDLLVCPTAKVGSVEIASTVKTIWANSFAGTLNLTEITFADGFSGDGFSIKEGAFTGSKISKITLPEGLTEIGDAMFKKCSNLAEIVVPTTVTRIGKEAFKECTNLSKLTFTPGGTEDLVFDDCSDTGTGTGSTSSIIFGCQNLKKLEFPERTTKIGACSFCGYHYQQGGAPTDYYSYLEEVTLPSTLKTIGDYAFYRNTKLKKLTFTDAKTAPATGILTISDYAFNNCAITGDAVNNEFKLPNTLKSIGEKAFSYSSKFKSVNIPKTVESIGTSAFSDMSSLEKVLFETGSKLATIGDYAFKCCENLDTIDFTKLGELTKVGDNAFYRCYDISVADFTGTKLSYLGAQAFYDCSSLSAVTLPSTIATLGNSTKALNSESNKTSANWGTVFMNCRKLTSCTFLTKTYKFDAYGNPIPDADTETAVARTEEKNDLSFVGYQCFANTGLTEFSFAISTAKSIEIVGGYQFEGCKSLSTIRLSRSVTNISNLFAKCTAIEQIVIASDSSFQTSTDANVPFILGTNGSRIVYGYAAVPTAEGCVYDLSQTNFTQINARAFEGQSGIKKLILPASLQQIDEYAFANCRQLEEIIFASGSQLTMISAHAFDGCPSLKSITVPNSVTTIGDYAFANCPSLETAKIGTSNQAQINRIGQYAFSFCTSLKSAEIYGNAEIGVEPSNSVGLYVTSYMFHCCKSLTDVTIYGEAWLGQYMFNYCTSLKKVVLNDKISKINGYAFNGCISLETMQVLKEGSTEPAGDDKVITLPSKVTGLGNIYSSSYNYYTGYVFKDCSSITKVVLPAGIEYIGQYTFQNCTSLATVTYVDATSGEDACDQGELILPAEIKAIGQYAFSNTAVTYAKLENLGEFTAKRFADTGTNRCENKYMFMDCKKLEKVTFSNTITSFAYTYINIKNKKVVESSEGMFAGCSSLKTIQSYDEETKKYAGEEGEATFWEGLTFLGTHPSYGTFMGCGFTKIIIPSTLRTICETDSATATTSAPSTNANTFKDCINLKTIVLTKSTYCIGKQVFMGCTSLKEILIASDTAAATAEGDGETGTEGGETRPEEIKTTLPSTLVVLGASAFEGAGFTDLTISTFKKPDGVSVTAFKIGGTVFKNCVNLKKVTLPATGFTELFSNMFEGCSKLTTIDTAGDTDKNAEGTVNISKITKINGSAFKNCTGISKVIFASNLTSFANSSIFEGCTNLATINVAGDTANNADNVINLTKISALQSSLFKNCSNIEKVILKSGLTSIGNSSVFEGCAKLTTINIAGNAYNAENVINLSTMTTMKASAFKKCTSITKVIFASGLTSLGSTNLFEDCTNLATINVAGDSNNEDNAFNLSKITTLYGSSFLNCTSVQKVILKNQEISFNLKAVFSGCTSLDTVFTLGDDANNKAGRANLSKITTAGTTSSYSEVFKGCAFTEVYMPELTTGGYNMFIDCPNLQTVTLGKLAEIPNGMFDGCAKLDAVTLGNNVTTIKNRAFAGTAITAFTVGDNIATIAADAFDGCFKTTFTVSEGNTAFKVEDGVLYTAADLGIAYNSAKLGAVGADKTYTCPVVENLFSLVEFLSDKDVETLIIPEGVKTIADKAFAVTSGSGVSMVATKTIESLKKIVLPSTLTSIGKYAFLGCPNLEEIEFAADSHLTTISEYAFKNCVNLKTVSFPDGLTELCTTGASGGLIFNNCTSLTKVTLPQSLKRIGDNVFNGCTSLSTINYRDANGNIVGADGDITLPDGLQKLGVSVFKDCTSLNPAKIRIYMEESETTAGTNDLGKSLFDGCTGLKNFVFESNLLTLSETMFNGCTGLESLTVPNTVTTLGKQVFNGCSSLNNVVIPESVTTMGKLTFNGCSSLKKVVIPASIATATGDTSSSISLTTKFEDYGLFNGMASDAVVIIECNTLETLNWSGWWWLTDATILYKFKGAPDPVPTVSDENTDGGNA